MGDAFDRGIELFNRRQYFQSHEAWEEILLTTSEAKEKKFLEALIQVAAALHLRFQRGGGRGTRNLLLQAMVTLEDFRPEHQGIDLEGFHRELCEYAERVEGNKEKKVGWLDRFIAPRFKRTR